MGLVDWRIVVAVGVVGLLVLLIGLRGKRADLLPRCRRRRCRYDLSAFIGEVKPGDGYPVTCPECGRVAQGEREVKWGKRKARRRVVWLGAVVLALCAMVGGVEVYARATNANTLAWMPLWLIIERVEHDTAENRHAHQAELFRRAKAGEITDERARRVIAQILEWQTDEDVSWGVVGDVFALLAMQGHATEKDIKQFWENVWEFEVVARTVIEIDDTPIISVQGVWRGHQREPLSFIARDGSASVTLPTRSAFRDGHFASRLEVSFTLNGETIRPFVANGNLYADYAQRADGRYVTTWSLHVAPGELDALGTDAGVLPITVCGEIVPVREPWGRINTASSGAKSPPPLKDELNQLGLRSSWAINETIEVRRVPKGEAAIELVRSDSLTQWMRDEGKAILRVRPGLHTTLEVTFGAFDEGTHALELPIVCKGVLRTSGGAEYPMLMRMQARTAPVYGLGSAYTSGQLLDHRTLPPNEQLTVVLTPDPAAAATTTDITRIWDGEIELPVVIDVIAPGAPHPMPGQMSKPPPTATTPTPAP